MSARRSTRDATTIAFNKPFGVLCQFRDEGQRETLAKYIDRPDVYPAGRLDRDSEGLLILTGDGRLQHRIAHPDHKWPKRYVVQLEGEPDVEALRRLEQGIELNDGPTRPCRCRLLDGEPHWLWPRDPPVRFRKSVPDHWVEITLREGRNRQLRRMSAAVGLPTLRLIRTAIGPVELGTLAPGQWRSLALRFDSG